MAEIKNFLLVFDHSEDQLIDLFDFDGDIGRATEEYSRLEHKYRSQRQVDVILVGSDSIETVKITHANYFPGTAKRLMHDALNLYAS